MARTRGGGVIRGASAQPRRGAGNPRVAGTRGGRLPVAARPPPVPLDSSAEAVAAAAQQYPGSNTVAAQNARDTLVLSPLSGGDGQFFQPPDAGGHTFPPQIGDNLVAGTNAMGGSPSAIGMPEVEAAGDVNAALGPDITYVFKRELGDGSIGIHDNVENTFVENNTNVAEDAADHPPIELETGACSGPFNTADKSSPQRLATTARRSSPLSPPKILWRMLYVDPDSDDPKRDARILENAASEALRFPCVFDVATDVVEALADLHEGTMLVYRGVFINDSLFRHKKASRPDKAIQGKHLARFLRLAGMKRRMVLLVAGGVDFDTADAGDHGLSAVLRKPFTKTGFCNILRGMFFGSEPKTDSSEPAGDAEDALSPVPRPPQASFRGEYLCPTKRLRGPEGVPHAAGAAAAAVGAVRCPDSGAAVLGGSAMMHVGRPPVPSYPACLGFTPFTPFTHAMIGAYPLGPGFLRLGQPPAGPQAGPQRKYTKIAPRELGGAVEFLAPSVEGNDRVVRVAAAEVSSVAVAADRAAGEQGILPRSAGADALGIVTGEVSGATKAVPLGGDEHASQAPELPRLPVSSVDDVLPGEHLSARGSTEAPAAESAAVPTPEAAR